MTYESMTGLGKEIFDNISRVLIGQEATVKLLITCLLSNGHVLLEDLPGTGKTTLAKALACSIDGIFQRIQFTPDLLPADITGMRIFQPDTHSFSFIPGPVFSNILLADEINRATPRTQSALLECMEETQVTDGGETRILVPPFFVIATQNPVETQGTFMLPEAQLDRFMMKLSMAVPTLDQTAEIMERIQLQHPIESLHAVTDKEALLQAIGEVKKVYLSHELFLYIASLCKAAQNPELVKLGPSPRAAIAVMRTSQAYAYLHGRNYVIPDDVKAVFLPVIHHRMILRGSSSEERISAFLTECMDKVPVPTEDRL